jgi:hypothetical protein
MLRCLLQKSRDHVRAQGFPGCAVAFWKFLAALLQLQLSRKGATGNTAKRKACSIYWQSKKAMLFTDVIDAIN